MPNNVAFGFCQCGCGKRTAIAKFNDPQRGYVLGQPYPFKRGHRNARGKDRKRNPSTTPVSTSERLRWAQIRATEAFMRHRQDPNDISLELAWQARCLERDQLLNTLEAQCPKSA